MTTLSTLLLPELEAEMKSTRRILAALPETDAEFKPHEKSRPLAKLASHIVDVASFPAFILTTPGYDPTVAPRKPSVMESKAQLLAQFDENAALSIAALSQSSDEDLQHPWSFTRGEYTIYSGPRYGAYRAMGLNHLIHHRAQLGCYIRDLNLPLPGTYGPSADGM